MLEKLTLRFPDPLAEAGPHGVQRNSALELMLQTTVHLLLPIIMMSIKECKKGNVRAGREF